MQKKLLFALPLLLIGCGKKSESATASIQSPLWTCGLDFHAEGGGLQAIVGRWKLKGNGSLNCTDVRGNKEHIPVDISVGGSLLAARVSFGHLCISGLGTGVGYASRPDALLGTYQTVNAKAAVAIAGAGATAATHFTASCNDCRTAATFNLSFQKVCGIGADVGYSNVTIRRAGY